MDSHDHESMSSPEHWQERQEAKARHGIRLQFPLRVAVRMWPEGPGAAYPKEKWPTPTKSDGSGGVGHSPNCQGGMNLRTAVQKWPTPIKHDAKSQINPSREKRANPGLAMIIKRRESQRETFPTPTVNDSKNNNPPSQALRNTPPLNVVVGGIMNPAWVEWLMGWPLGWTDLHASATDRFRQWCASHGDASD